MHNTSTLTETALPQYELVQNARNSMFAHCGTLSQADFITPLSGFGDSSVRNLLVHIVNVYRFWLGSFALHQGLPSFRPEQMQRMDDIRPLFAQTDLLVNIFLHRFQSAPETPITGKIPGREEPFATKPLTIFTHVITHEFHHKGQIMSMTRQLGYIPPDTDIIRFS